MHCWSLARNLFHPQFHFLEFFLYIRNTYFQERLRVFVIHFFTAVCQATIYSLYFFVSSKNQAHITASFFWCLLQHWENTFTEFFCFSEKAYFISPLAGCLFYYCFDLLICIIDTVEKSFLIQYSLKEAIEDWRKRGKNQ